jgi:HEAT repeat protein
MTTALRLAAQRLLSRAARVAILATALSCTSDVGYANRSSHDWIAQLDEPAPTARAQAADALGHILLIDAKNSRVIGALTRVLADTVDAVRTSAAVALIGAGDRAAPAAPAVARLLSDSAHQSVRVLAADVLERIAQPATPVVIAALRNALHDPDVEVRRRAIRVLGGLAPDDGDIVAAISTLLTDPSLVVRISALDALARMRGAASPAVVAVTRALADSNAGVREAATYALAQLGAVPAATAAATAAIVAEPLHDRDATVRAGALYALGSLGRADDRAVIAAALSDPDSIVRREASHALSAFHRHGGRDEALGEPTPEQKCGPRSRVGDRC